MVSTKKTRVLGVARLSRDTDESTSIERQTEHLRGYAASRGAELVHVASDIDVSGAMSPFERPGLGPWLADQRVGEYDVIAAVKIDRLSRSLVDFVGLIDWADRHGKTVVAFQDGVDTSTPTGKLIAKLLSLFGEWEREAVRARVLDSIRHAMAEGRYHGGAVPSGYRAVKTADGWRLMRDEERAALIREAYRRVVAGESINSIAMSFNERGILSPEDHRRATAGKPTTGARWTSGNLARVLRSRALVGDLVRSGEVVRGKDGLPVQRADAAVLTYSEYDRLQAALNAMAASPRRSRTVSPLSGILWCQCGQPAYRVVPDDKRRDRYRCRSSVNKAVRTWCGTPSVLASVVDSVVNTLVIAALGRTPVTRRVLVPGSDSSAELERVRESIADLEADRYQRHLFRGEQGTQRYVAMMDRLESRLAELAALPQRADEWRELPVKNHDDDCPHAGDDTADCPCAPLEWWIIWPDIVQDAERRREFLLRSPWRFVVGDVVDGARAFRMMHVPAEGAPFAEWEEVVQVVHRA